LPTLPNPPGPHYPAPTLRQLLDQHSGLVGNRLHALYREAGEASDPLTEESLQPLVAPGRLYVYSNPGYELAGRALAAANQSDYESLLRDRVFVPLKMTQAGFEAREDDARPHRDGNTMADLLARDRVALGVRASLAEVEQLLIAMTASAEVSALPVAELAIAQDTQAPLDLGNRYGYALAIEQSSRAELGEHASLTGFYPGYFLRIEWWPQRHLAIVALANSMDAGDAGGAAIDKIADAWFAVSGVPPRGKPQPPRQPLAIPPIAKLSIASQRYSTPFGLIAIEQDGDQFDAEALGLHFRATPRGDGWYAVSLQLWRILPVRVGALKRILVAPVRIGDEDFLIGNYEARSFVLGAAWQPPPLDDGLRALAGRWHIVNPDGLIKRIKLRDIDFVADDIALYAEYSLPGALINLRPRIPVERSGIDTLIVPGLGALLGGPLHLLQSPQGTAMEFMGYRVEKMKAD
jgi:Beta-lactamase